MDEIRLVPKSRSATFRDLVRGVALSILTLLAIFVVTFPFLAGYYSMTIGAAFESRGQYAPFGFYSSSYYGDHRADVEGMACSRAVREVYGPIRPGWPQILTHPLGCLEPSEPPVAISWCPALLRVFFGMCTSVAYSDEVRQLPGFVEGLQKFLVDPCVMDETRAAEMRLRAFDPKEFAGRYSKNDLCLRPRIVVVYFVDARDKITKTIWHFP